MIGYNIIVYMPHLRINYEMFKCDNTKIVRANFVINKRKLFFYYDAIFYFVNFKVVTNIIDFFKFWASSMQIMIS